MFNLIATGKQYRLGNGQIIIVNKLNLKDYYLLIASLLIYKKAIMKITEIKEKKTIKEHLDFMRENSMDYAKAQVEFDNIKKYLKPCIDIDIDKYEQNEVIEILNCVLDFNSIKLGTGGREFESIDELNNDLEIRVGIIANMLQMSPDRVLELNNYEVCVLIRENNRRRISIMQDLRVAQNADKIEYQKYTRSLLGEKIYSGSEVINNPKIMEDIH